MAISDLSVVFCCYSLGPIMLYVVHTVTSASGLTWAMARSCISWENLFPFFFSGRRRNKSKFDIMRAGTDVVRLHLCVVEEVLSSFTSVTAAYCRVHVFLLFQHRVYLNLQKYCQFTEWIKLLSIENNHFPSAAIYWNILYINGALMFIILILHELFTGNTIITLINKMLIYISLNLSQYWFYC